MYLKAYFEKKENRVQEIKDYTDKTEYLELGDVKYLRKDLAVKSSERMVVKLIFEGKLKIVEGYEDYFDNAINDYLDKKNKTSEPV